MSVLFSAAEEFEQFLEKEKLRGKLGGITLSHDEDRPEYRKQVLLIADEDEQYIEQVRENFSALFHVMAATDVNAALSLVAAYNDRGSDLAHVFRYFHV